MANKTVGITATLIVAANSARASIVILNNGNRPLYIGPDNTVSTTNGLLITQSGTFQEDSGGTRVYQGDIWGISTFNIDVRYWERTK